MWLDESENADRCYENQTPYTAMEQRILITHWVGDAWETLCGTNYEHLRKRCWEKTGYLITADGSDDDKISPEGLLMYKVPPPIDYIPATEALPTINQALGDEDETDFIHQEEDPEDFDAGADEPNNDGEEFEDHEDHRSENAPYCGRKLKALNTKMVGTQEKWNITTNIYRRIIYNLMTAPMTILPKTKSIWWKKAFFNFISASSYHHSI